MHLTRHWFPAFLVVAVHALLLALMLQSGPQAVTPPQVMEMMLLAPVDAVPLPQPPEPVPPPPVVPPPPKVEPRIEPRVSPPPVVETQAPAPVIPEEQAIATPDPVPVPPAPAATPVPVAAPEPVVVQPRIDASYKGNPKPVYPPLSRRLGEAGVVTLRVYVKEDGTVGEMQLQRSSGFPRLDRSAMDAVGRWKFVPAKRGAQPFATWYTLPVNFDLEK